MGTMMSCATLSRKLMDRVHCRTDGLMVVLSGAFFETLACVAPLETEMQSTIAINARSGIYFYFTANGLFWILNSSAHFSLLSFRARLRARRFLGRRLLLAQQPVHGANQLRNFIVALL